MGGVKTYLLKNWKTSAAGVAMLVLAALELAGVNVTGVTNMSPGALIMSGLAAFGLIAAKDASS